jgi:hypothetical protein
MDGRITDALSILALSTYALEKFGSDDVAI